MRELIFNGYAGPIVGVVEVNGSTGQLSAWRCCVLCGWRSTKFITEDVDAAMDASKAMVSEQSEHVRINHSDLMESVVRDTGGKGVAAAMGAC